MKRVNREYEQILIDDIQSGQDEGALRTTGPAWLIAYGVIGMVGWTNRWFNPNESPVDASAIGTAFADTLLGGLATEADATALSRLAGHFATHGKQAA
jgi:hypothetical protein